MNTLVADQHLDAKGLNCPLPVLRTKVALAAMPAGQVLSVLATDPYSVADFQAFCEHTGHTLLQVVESDAVFEFFIRRAPT